MCEHPNAFREVKRRARKEHTCWECDLPIRVGTVYSYSSGIWHREPESYHVHVECRALLLAHPDDDGCWVYGTLAEIARINPVAEAEWLRIQALYAVPIPPTEVSP